MEKFESVLEAFRKCDVSGNRTFGRSQMERLLEEMGCSRVEVNRAFRQVPPSIVVGERVYYEGFLRWIYEETSTVSADWVKTDGYPVSPSVPKAMLGSWLHSCHGHTVNIWDTGDGRIRFTLLDGLVTGLLRPTEDVDDDLPYSTWWPRLPDGNFVRLCPVGAGWFEGPLVDGGGFVGEKCSDYWWACVRWDNGALEVHFRVMGWGPRGSARARCKKTKEAENRMYVRQDPPADLPAEVFFSRQSLFSALATGNTVFLKGRWLIGWAKTGKPLPRRQELPSGAAWDPSDLVTRMVARGDVPIVAISYCWKEAWHPDPQAEQLQALAQLIEKRLAVQFPDGPKYVRCTPMSHDLAVFIDYCSYPQAPRNEAEVDLFKRGLKDVNLWYAHEATESWLMTEPLLGKLPYESRGWPTFERCISSIATRRHALLDFGQYNPAADVDKYWGKIWRRCTAKRQPPITPSTFCVLLETKVFTNNADVDMVKENFTNTFYGTIAKMKQFNFAQMGWSDEEALALADCLPYCKELSGLALFGNKIGPRGGAALAAHIDKCPKLTMVLMGRNPVGDEVLQEFRRWQSRAAEGMRKFCHNRDI